MMKPHPDRVYLVRGSTLARLEEELRRRTPLPSNADDSIYRGPRGFTLPRGSGRVGPAPFEVSVQGEEIFVAPGIVSTAHYYGEPFVPRASQGGTPLDDFPAPSCGTLSMDSETFVHLTFDCELDASPLEQAYVGGRVNDAWVRTAFTRLPYRESFGEELLHWRFTVVIGRVRAGGAGVVSLMNTNLQPSFVGPYYNYPPDVEGAVLHALPTMTLFSPITSQI